MKIEFYICFFLVVFSSAAHAEVFKCQSAQGKTIYQPTPCSPKSASQRVLEVEKMTPEEMESAKIKLRSWQEQQAIEEAAKAQAERERRLERERQESLTLQRRSVLAQEQQAIAAQRQNQYRPGGFVYPYYRCSRSPWENYDWEHRYRSGCDPRFNNYSPMPQFQPPMPQPSRVPPPKPWSGRPLSGPSVNKNTKP